MIFLFITNNPEIAIFALQSGVDRVFVDLEINGKKERQAHTNAVINFHTMDDVIAMRKVVPKGALLVRVNPWNEESYSEIDYLIELGVDHIMLPMFTTLETAGLFVETVGSRANPILLVETYESLKLLPEIATLPISEFYVGLNDLSISAKLEFLFDPLALGWIDDVAKTARLNSLPFGFGGVGLLGTGKVPAELILAEHARLGSSSVILSRAFHQGAKTLKELKEQLDFPREIEKMRDLYSKLLLRSREEMQKDKAKLDEIISSVSGCSILHQSDLFI